MKVAAGRKDSHPRGIPRNPGAGGPLKPETVMQFWWFPDSAAIKSEGWFHCGANRPRKRPGNRQEAQEPSLAKPQQDSLKKRT